MKKQYVEDTQFYVRDTIEENDKLRRQNENLVRENKHYQLKLQEKDYFIDLLQRENQKLKFELQLALKTQQSDLYSAVSLDRFKSNNSMIQPKRKRIFETKKTTLHMNNLSPKKTEQDDIASPDVQEPRPKKYSEDELHRVVVQEIQVQEFPESTENSSRVEQIIQKYSKNKLEQCRGEISNTTSQIIFPEEPIQLEQIIEKEQEKLCLFEEFLIISVQKSTLNGMNLLESREAVIKPEILFQHSSPNSCCQEQLQLLPQYIHPYGLKIKLEEKTLSMSNLNSILMGGQSYDRLSGAYVITMKSEKTFNSQNLKQSGRKFDIDNVTELISETNLNHQLYCVCVDVPDFFDYNICQNNNKLQKKYFYSFTKTYCFITRAPVIDFFIETIKILISNIFILIDTLKYKKAEIYSMVFEIEETLQNIDSSFYTSFKPELYNFLSSLQIVEYLSKFEYQFLQTPIKAPYYHNSDTNLYEIEWAISYALSHIELPHYLILLISMLLESNVCIICTNRTLLSSLLMILPHMISPFQYIHPTIFALTAQLLPILDSPVPFTCGIIKDPDDGLQQLGIDDEEQFYDSIGHVLFFDANRLRFYNLQKNLTETKIYTTLFYQLFQTYSQIRSQSVPGQYLAENNEVTMNLSFQILQDTKTYLNKNLLSCINCDENDNLDSLQEKTLNSTEDEIFKQIIKTQYFSYYLQQHYSHLK